MNEQLEKGFDLQYAASEGLDPLEFVANASLALHHHMAPADGSFDLELENEDESL